MRKQDMKNERPYKFSVSLTDKEDRQLIDLAIQYKVSKQQIVVDALEAYARKTPQSYKAI